MNRREIQRRINASRDALIGVEGEEAPSAIEAARMVAILFGGLDNGYKVEYFMLAFAVQVANVPDLFERLRGLDWTAIKLAADAMSTKKPTGVGH